MTVRDGGQRGRRRGEEWGGGTTGNDNAKDEGAQMEGMLGNEIW